MQTPARPSRRVETELDALLLHIEAIAFARACDSVPKQAAVDIARDVMVHCLVKIRNGNWDIAADEVPRFVRHLAHSRSVDFLRRRERGGVRETDHAQELEKATHTWMAPDDTTEERLLAEVHGRALSDLPDGCRRVYLMVRDSHDTYAVVGKRLGISASAVSRHVVKAQHLLRKGLLACGIAAPPPRRGPASRQAQSRPGSCCRS